MIKENMIYNQSVKPNTEFLEQLREKLPEFFTVSKNDEEATFDLEKFQRALKEQNIEELSSGYQLDFIGKNYAKKQAGERPTTVIVPDKEHNNKPENKDSKNLFFTGDNLEVLRHLQQNYANSVDFIYIDPPYNTGSDGFVYPDKFEYSDDQLKNMFGLNDDELKRMKSIQGKSTHSAWLTFMYPRLYLAKKLMKDTSVIFVSIDDNEQANLKLLMDEIFGEESFITNFVWEKKKKPSFLNNNLGTKFEYITVYSKNRMNSQPFSVDMTTEGKKYPFNNSGNGMKVLEFPSGSIKFTKLKDGMVKAQDMSSGNIKTKLLNDFKIEDGTNTDNVLLEGEWRYSQQKLDEFVKNESLITISSIPFRPNLTMAGGEIKKMHNLLTVDQYQVATNEDASEEFTKLMGGNYFDFTKPSRLIKLLLKSYLYNNPNGIILDFFAGSSTTADAVMQFNIDESASSRYIMVQLPEPTKFDSSAYKAGYTSIDQISRARIEKAAAKIQSENPLSAEAQDFGFKHFRVVEPTQETLDKIEYDDDLQLDMFDDMITAFSSESLEVEGNAEGFDTILQTYLVSDNYKFDVPIEMLDFGGIQLPYVNNQRIYIITNDWTAANTKALVNAIGKNEISVQTIVVYGYTIAMESLRELEIALNQLENKVHLLVRY